MKLWRLMVSPVLGSDGAKEKKMLREFAGAINEPGMRILATLRKKMYSAFVITNDAETAQTIGERWELTYGRPIECEDVPFLGCDLIFPDSNARVLAKYYDVSPDNLARMMEQCYGVRAIRPEPVQEPEDAVLERTDSIDIDVKIDMKQVDMAIKQTEHLVELLESAADLMDRLAKRLGSGN